MIEPFGPEMQLPAFCAWPSVGAPATEENTVESLLHDSHSAGVTVASEEFWPLHGMPVSVHDDWVAEIMAWDERMRQHLEKEQMLAEDQGHPGQVSTSEALGPLKSIQRNM